MKVLHVSFNDISGGAARAAHRLHCAQVKCGIESHMLVVNKESSSKRVLSVKKTTGFKIKLANYITNKVKSLISKPTHTFQSFNLIPTGLADEINEVNADVVNFHWFGSNMIAISELTKIKSPLVFTLHDMWLFLASEHYTENEFSDMTLDVCGNLMAKVALKKKVKYLPTLNCAIVTPSHWLKECADNSILSTKDSYAIPNCVPPVYLPQDKLKCRDRYNLPRDKKLLLFGAMSSTSDPRKGYHLLESSLISLKDIRDKNDVELVVFGASSGDTEKLTGIKTHYVGNLSNDEDIAMLYNAASVFVAPSLQDNLPNTLVESLACGTPCVAFNIGGMKDLISDGVNGALVDKVDSDDLAYAINRVLNTSFESSVISEQAALTRSENKVVKKYNEIYKRVSV
ncbi:glycosyltransferase [Vibrio fluvialis]|nr:glycosyltransferase [Vibrio fluvialis]